MRYGYATVKVVPDYGETAELEKFLEQVNREGWKIEHVLPHDEKYFTFIYVYDADETPRNPTRVRHKKAEERQ